MASIARLLVKQNTVLKLEPVQASLLPSSKLQNVSVGTQLVLQSFGETADNDNHIRISLKDIAFKGFGTNWYAYEPHVEVVRDSFKPVQPVSDVLSKQSEKNVVKISVSKPTSPGQGGLLKLVFNVDTVIKRAPVESRFLDEKSLQKIPAGTELVLLTNNPDANNVVKLPIQDSHVKFSLKDIEFKGFSKDWFAFVQHVGIQKVG